METTFSSFHCKDCNASYKSARSLKQHQLFGRCKFKCSSCNYESSADIQVFIEHCLQKNHDQSDEFKCPVWQCDFIGNVSNEFENIEKHFKEKHKGRDPRTRLYCRQCFFTTKYLTLFVQHCSKFQHKQNGHECPYCNFKANEHIRFEFHIQKEHKGQKAFTCDTCNTGFTRRNEMLFHKSLKHGEEGTFAKTKQCDICQKRCHPKEFKIHLKSHSETKAEYYKCNLCFFEFKIKSSLEKHIERDHLGIPNTPKKIYHCDICGKSYRSQSGLKDHKANYHTFEKKYKCSFCDFKSTSINHVNRHVSSRHMTQNCKRKYPKVIDLKCHICEKDYSTWISFKNHKKIHDNKKEFTCDLCDYTANVKQNLINHKKHKHLKIKNFTCDKCKKSFVMKETLQRHVSHVHQKDQLDVEKCEHCDFSTTHASSMKRHVTSFHSNKTSSGGQCEICGTHLKSKANLVNHMKRKHENKSLECTKCEYSTSTNSDFVKHCRNTHLN